ncbi:T-cell receptor beta chain V region YT35 [Myotis brandtii]|nr:T-cell receptor beta chain V region YT35 [Myotis brandtii]
MTIRLLCCAVLCLLGVEPTDAGVTQTPRHKVTKKGQGVTLSCEPISGHTYLYWYRQTSVQGLEFLISFSGLTPFDDTGMPKERFSAKMPNGSFSTLEIQPTEPGDSAMYLCASSLATALQSHPLPVQKPSCSPFSLQPSVILSKCLSCSSLTKRNECVWGLTRADMIKYQERKT